MGSKILLINNINKLIIGLLQLLEVHYAYREKIQ